MAATSAWPALGEELPGVLDDQLRVTNPQFAPEFVKVAPLALAQPGDGRIDWQRQVSAEGQGHGVTAIIQ